MPSRIVFRRGVRGGRVTQFYRNRSVVPGGQTKRVAPGSSRNAPVYAYQRPQLTARKLVHFNPLVSATIDVHANSGSGLYPAALANGVLLNGILQGDGLDSRHANKAWMRDLQLGYKSYIPNVASRYNVLVVYDRESRGVSPSLSDIFDVPASLLTQQRVVNRERFDILFRKEMVMAPMRTYDGSGTVGYDTAITEADYSFRVPINRMAFYSGSSALLGDILKGGLFLFFWSSPAPDPSNLLVSVNYRLEFVDVE